MALSNGKIAQGIFNFILDEKIDRENDFRLRDAESVETDIGINVSESVTREAEEMYGSFNKKNE